VGVVEEDTAPLIGMRGEHIEQGIIELKEAVKARSALSPA
jgi:hypothetical protein